MEFLSLFGVKVLLVAVGVFDVTWSVVGVDLGNDSVEPTGVEFLSCAGSDRDCWIPQSLGRSSIRSMVVVSLVLRSDMLLVNVMAVIDAGESDMTM